MRPKQQSFIQNVHDWQRPPNFLGSRDLIQHIHGNRRVLLPSLWECSCPTLVLLNMLISSTDSVLLIIQQKC